MMATVDCYCGVIRQDIYANICSFFNESKPKFSYIFEVLGNQFGITIKDFKEHCRMYLASLFATEQRVPKIFYKLFAENERVSIFKECNYLLEELTPLYFTKTVSVPFFIDPKKRKSN